MMMRSRRIRGGASRARIQRPVVTFAATAMIESLLAPKPQVIVSLIFFSLKEGEPVSWPAGP